MHLFRRKSKSNKATLETVIGTLFKIAVLRITADPEKPLGKIINFFTCTGRDKTGGQWPWLWFEVKQLLQIMPRTIVIIVRNEHGRPDADARDNVRIHIDAFLAIRCLRDSRA